MDAAVLRIAKLTDYAIVVLAHVARNAHVCVHSASDLADATGVPAPTVAKVLKLLARDGLLHSTRGAHGGYGLARDPGRISVADVIAAVEGPMALTACSAPGDASCSDEHHCQVSGHWPSINAAVRTALEGVSILELSKPMPRQAARLHAVDAAAGK